LGGGWVCNKGVGARPVLQHFAMHHDTPRCKITHQVWFGPRHWVIVGRGADGCIWVSKRRPIFDTLLPAIHAASRRSKEARDPSGHTHRRSSNVIGLASALDRLAWEGSVGGRSPSWQWISLPRSCQCWCA